LLHSPAFVEAARHERDVERYRTHGCDSEDTPQPNGNLAGPLHVAMSAGSNTTGHSMGLMQLVECSHEIPGATHVFPPFWTHRPRLAPSIVSAATLVLYDNAYDEKSFGELSGNAHNQSVRQGLSASAIRTELLNVIKSMQAASTQASGKETKKASGKGTKKSSAKKRKSLMRDAAQFNSDGSATMQAHDSVEKPSPMVDFSKFLKDGVIARFHDKIIGMTDDDDWDKDDDDDDDDDDD